MERPCHRGIWFLALVCATSAAKRWMPPLIYEQPDREEVIYNIDSFKTLPCLATGIPEPEYRWTKDGEDWEKIPLMEGTGSIHFVRLDESDEGTYQCFAFNPYGVALSRVVHLRRARFYARLSSTQTVDHTVIVGSYLMLPLAGIDSVPNPTYSWTLAGSVHDDHPSRLPDTTRRNVDTHGEDGAAENDHPAKAFVTQAPLALRKKDIVMKCLFKGKPAPRVSWEKKDGKLPSGRSELTSHDTMLTISDPREEDSGTYICKGTNDHGFAEEEITVNVEAVPFFREEMKSMNVTNGATVTFQCDVDGVPEVNIQWLRNGEPLVPNAHMDLSNDKRTLTISDVRKETVTGTRDLMVLQCNASNDHGHCFGNAYLNVLEPTEITVGPQDVTVDYPNEVKFHCQAVGDDLTSVTIEWLRNGEQITYQEGHMEKTDENSLRIFTANNSDTLDDLPGVYTCVATNGISDASSSATLWPSESPVVAAVYQMLWVNVGVCGVLVVAVIISLICWIKIRRREKAGQAAMVTVPVVTPSVAEIAPWSGDYEGFNSNLRASQIESRDPEPNEWLGDGAYDDTVAMVTVPVVRPRAELPSSSRDDEGSYSNIRASQIRSRNQEPHERRSDGAYDDTVAMVTVPVITPPAELPSSSRDGNLRASQIESRDPEPYEWLGDGAYDDTVAMVTVPVITPPAELPSSSRDGNLRASQIIESRDPEAGVEGNGSGHIYLHVE